MTNFRNAPSAEESMDVSRREFLGTTASAVALLALNGSVSPAQVSDRIPQISTYFLNLSHENYRGQQYTIFIAGDCHPLQEIESAGAAERTLIEKNRLLSALPGGKVTHFVKGVTTSKPEVLLAYVTKNGNSSTGYWEMSSVYLIPPASGLVFAYSQARKSVGDQESLPLSAKRAMYGLPAAHTFQDLLDESMLLDATDWATALMNVHPELLSAEPNSAAHIQTNYIHNQLPLIAFAGLLSTLGTAKPQNGTSDNGDDWATLVPILDKSQHPLRNQNGKCFKGYILYDPKWNPILTSGIRSITATALQFAKSDPLLGVNIADKAEAAAKRGAIWTRTDGITAVDQTDASAQNSSDSQHFTLTNVTPNFAGYNCTVTNDGSSVTLSATNWYVRYLGLFIQFYKGTEPVPIDSLPSGTLPQNPFTTKDNEALLAQISPEFTLFGIPIESSGATHTFNFPSGVADSARILASGLGVGSSVSPDSETLGALMTVIFNLILPANLLALGLGTDLTLFVKTIAIPSALLVAKAIIADVIEFNYNVILTLFWRSIASGLLSGFFAALTAFIGGAEAAAILEDSIPIAGLILQAIGIAGTVATIAETTAETLLSPKSYVYTLVGTYDLSISINPDSSHGKFPSTADTYKLTAMFDNGVPHTLTASLPSSAKGTNPVIRATFNGVPVGGQVSLSVGIYAVDGTLVGKGSVDNYPNVPSSATTAGPSITITELQIPVTHGTVYQHKQITALDNNGNHLWVCASAPPAPESLSACEAVVNAICTYQGITVSPKSDDIGYGWQSYSENVCEGSPDSLYQLASLRANDAPADASNYKSLPCALKGAAHLAYDPLGRADANFYVDTSDGTNLLRNVSLTSSTFPGPKSNAAWGRFNLASDQLLLHPSGVALSLNQVSSRLESLKLPTSPVSDAVASTQLLAELHGGQGSRPGLFNKPILATITSEGVVLVLEKDSNRLHAVDAFGNPVKHFKGQRVPYYFVLAETGSDSNYLDIASEYSGLVYVLSYKNGIFRLDIYDPAAAGTMPLSTTQGFNAARVTVDYWRDVYSLNYAALVHGTTTEPSVSQWTPLQPPRCSTQQPLRRSATRLLRRRDLFTTQYRLA